VVHRPPVFVTCPCPPDASQLHTQIYEVKPGNMIKIRTEEGPDMALVIALRKGGKHAIVRKTKSTYNQFVLICAQSQS